MPLDPEVEALLAQMASMGQPPLQDLPVDEARQVAQVLALLDGEPEPVADVKDRVVAGVPVRLYRPVRSPDPLATLAWFHAGGGVVGNLETADRTCRKLANRSGALVVSVGYRLAPEHPFPAGVDDCWTVTQWLGEHADELGGDCTRLGVGGDSMGGGMAAVVALRAARHGAPRLRHQLLVYPFADLTLSQPSVDEYADGYLLTRSLCEWFIDLYLGPEGDPKDPEASPLFADDVGGCAPATIVTAEFDPVRDEAEEYARRLRDAGVPVSLQRIDGMIHVFFAFGAVLERARRTMDDVGETLRAAL